MSSSERNLGMFDFLVNHDAGRGFYYVQKTKGIVYLLTHLLFHNEALLNNHRHIDPLRVHGFRSIIQLKSWLRLRCHFPVCLSVRTCARLIYPVDALSQESLLEICIICLPINRKMHAPVTDKISSAVILNENMTSTTPSCGGTTC